MSEEIEGRSPFSPLIPPELLLPDTREVREQNWQQMTEYFSTVTDAVGTPIDEKVFEAVVGLNLHGIITSSSDEGHPEQLYAAPWIQFIMPDDSFLSNLVNELDEQTDYLYDVDPENPEVVRLMEVYTTSYKELVSGRGKVFQQTAELLSEFYRGRTITDWKTILTINTPHRIIQPNGVDMQPAESDEQRRSNLEAFQTEMQAFGAFLHQRYVNGDDTGVE